MRTSKGVVIRITVIKWLTGASMSSMHMLSMPLPLHYSCLYPQTQRQYKEVSKAQNMQTSSKGMKTGLPRHVRSRERVGPGSVKECNRTMN